jgi:hypothetical protein
VASLRPARYPPRPVLVSLSRWRVAFALVLFAAALRVWDLGNPVIHVDEQWYLLVGDRLLAGAVPFVDIWDRKPAGLFLLFAGLRRMGGSGVEGGVLAYQLAAWLCAVATALLVVKGARTAGAEPRGAWAAGAAYLFGLSLLGGRGGQAPVFYNLPVAAAGVLALGLPDLAREGRRQAIMARGALACALAGLAIQIKYTAAVEGAFVGLVHLLYLRRAGGSWAKLAGAGALWLALGLGPTVAVGAWYRAAGAWDAWWFANFASIALRPGYPADQLAMRLLGISAQLSPLALAAVLSWRMARTPARSIAFGWLAAALGGFAAIGTWFDHYALPLLAPLAICAAPALGRRLRLLVATLGLMGTIWAVGRITARDDAGGARGVAALVARESRAGCPYVFAGDTIAYYLARACLPTPYAFPNLLSYTTEQGATGIDEAAEVRRILAARPPVIVANDRRLEIWNPGSLAALRAVLPEYRLALKVRRAGWHMLVYVRRSPPAPVMPGASRHPRPDSGTR